VDSRPDLVRAAHPLIDDCAGAALQAVRDKCLSGACRADLVPGHNRMLIYLAAEGLIEARKVGPERGSRAGRWRPDCVSLVSGDVRTIEVRLSQAGLTELALWETESRAGRLWFDEQGNLNQ